MEWNDDGEDRINDVMSLNGQRWIFFKNTTQHNTDDDDDEYKLFILNWISLSLSFTFVFIHINSINWTRK